MTARDYTNRVLRLLIPLCVLLAGCTDKPPKEPPLPAGWVKVAPPGMGFSVNMPKQPKASKQSAYSQAGPINSDLFIVDDKGVRYTVIVTTFEETPYKSEATKLLDGIHDSVITKRHLKTQKDEKNDLNGAPGFRLEGETGDGKALFYQALVKGNRAYTYSAIGAPEDIAAAAPFMDSFRLK